MVRFGRIFRFILIQLLLLIFFLSLAELFLRVVAPISVVQSPAMSQEFTQNIPGLQAQIKYERNQFGLRTNTLNQYEKSAETIRIFCLGASTTDQATQSYADTWCGLLESGLNAELAGTGLRVETAAYGRGGWRAVHQAFFRPNLTQFSADYAIFMLGINDLALNGSASYRYDGIDALTEKLKEPGIVSANPRIAACVRRSQLCRRANLIKDAWEIWRDKQAGKLLEWHSENLPQLRAARQQYPLHTTLDRNPDPYDEFVDVMDLLVSDLLAEGIQPIILGQPTLWKAELSEAEEQLLWMPIETPAGQVRVDGAWLTAEMARYNAGQKAVAKAHGVLYVGLEDVVGKSAENFFDDTHFTDLGSQTIAHELISLIYPLLSNH